MSKRRTMPGAYSQKQPRGPNGERLCRWCKGPVAPPKLTFCSGACVHEWKLRTDPGYVRHQVFKRDKGVCARCGRDTEAIRRELGPRPTKDYWDKDYWQRVDAYHERCKAMNVPRGRKTLWDADHITPVVEGGGECGIDNYRTLCLWCHKVETARLAHRRSKGGRQGRLDLDPNDASVSSPE